MSGNELIYLVTVLALVALAGDQYRRRKRADSQRPPPKD